MRGRGGREGGKTKNDPPRVERHTCRSAWSPSWTPLHCCCCCGRPYYQRQHSRPVITCVCTVWFVTDGEGKNVSDCLYVCARASEKGRLKRLTYPSTDVAEAAPKLVGVCSRGERGGCGPRAPLRWPALRGPVKKKASATRFDSRSRSRTSRPLPGTRLGDDGPSRRLGMARV